MALQFIVRTATPRLHLLGVVSAYNMVYNSRFLYGRKITLSCLWESDVSVICHHPISILSHNQIQCLAYMHLLPVRRNNQVLSTANF